MNDDWKVETQALLAKSAIYSKLKEKCANDEAAGAQAIALVNEAVEYAYQRTKSILRHMNEFTLHDGDHLFRVLHLMERVLTEKNIRSLSIPELMLLTLSAFYHDLGMAVDEFEVL